MADNTTSDLGYKYVDPEDVTLKNLDTEKAATTSRRSRETRMKFEDGLVHGASAKSADR